MLILLEVLRLKIERYTLIYEYLWHELVRLENDVLELEKRKQSRDFDNVDYLDIIEAKSRLAEFEQVFTDIYLCIRNEKNILGL